jgi:hypothetical protein
MTYMNKNKRGILLSTMTEYQRREHGLQQVDGTVASLWSQGAESAHIKLKRRILSQLSHGRKLTFTNTLRAVETYFDEARNDLIQARCKKDCWVNLTCCYRIGASPRMQLKNEYSHLRANRGKFFRNLETLSETEKFRLLLIQRSDIWKSWSGFDNERNVKAW